MSFSQMQFWLLLAFLLVAVLAGTSFVIYKLIKVRDGTISHYF